MDKNSLLEALKFLWLAVQVILYLIRRKREKALIEVLEKHNQRPKLRKKVKKRKS